MEIANRYSLGKFLILFQAALLLGCSRTDSDVTLYDGKQMFGTNTTVLRFEKQPQLARENNSVRFKLAMKWSLEDGVITTQDGKQVRLVVKVFDSKGERYSPVSYGEVIGQDHLFAANFSSFKQGTRLERIELMASGEILCNQILWHSYDPL